MIAAGGRLPILIATKPVDFRCGHQALALMVQASPRDPAAERALHLLRAQIALARGDVQQARGDVLSRVTNDIDNVAQSLQQSISVLLTSVLTIIGTIAMMLWISWELAIVAVLIVLQIV